ncbi:MAG: hypothetical protein NVS3B21_29890 [Acidimicrobiales bacterium]
MSFDPTELITVLDAHSVRYILIGGMAATLHGAEYVTGDLDITPDAALDNLERLSVALDDLEARIRVESDPGGLQFAHDAQSLSRVQVWNLVTRAGDLDISFAPSGTGGYPDLRRDAMTISIHGITVTIASLADIVRSKEAAGRDKDRAALPMLRRLLNQLDG